MIKITLYQLNNGTPSGFKIKGHADFAKSGDDIVCSAVSSAAYLVANTVTDIMHINATATQRQSGEMILKIPKESAEKSKDILLGFKLHIEELTKQYPKNVTITTTEV